MEKFYFEEPSIERKQEALDYIEEFRKYKSNINGVGGLNKFVDNYDGWLVKLEEDQYASVSKERVPSVTYFLVRSNDSQIVGMINIRLALNEYLKKGPGHIGYSIRPSERRKGYNKLNLYMGLKICYEHGIDKVLLDANHDNPASWKTMEALGGKRVKEWVDEGDNMLTYNYEIDTLDSLKKNEKIYEPMIDYNNGLLKARKWKKY